MSVVITSTTADDAELQHAVSNDWRTAVVEQEEPKPATEQTPAAQPQATETDVQPRTETKPREQKPANQQPRKTQSDKRIERLVTNNSFLQEQLEKTQRELEQERAGKTQQSEPAAAVKQENAAEFKPSKPEPQLGDFKGADAWEQYYKAHTNWIRATAKEEALWELKQETPKQIEQSLTERQQREQHEAEHETSRQRLSEHNHRVIEAQSRYDDWNEVVTADIRVPQSATLAIIEAENGPDIMYYLGQNPDFTQELFDKTPIGVVRAIGKLSDQLAAENGGSKAPAAERPAASRPAAQPQKPAATTEPAVRPNTQSRAPAPIRPVSGTPSKVGKSIHDPEISQAEFARLRRQAERERSGL